tara:strand:- start:2878 stop:3270 length:393 start_codon:yes stop_codon:yes gene_type:complete
MSETASNEKLISKIKENYGPECHWIGEVNGDIVMIYLLMFHCAVLINPSPIAGYEQRYCYHSPEIALKAIAEYSEAGGWRYWKKDHTANISVALGNMLFKSGDLQEPDRSIGEVDWDISDYDKKYPYSYI